MSNTRIGYMDKTDFDYHLEEDSSPSKIYSSIKDLERAVGCVRDGECGIVRVTVTIEEVVRKGTSHD